MIDSVSKALRAKLVGTSAITNVVSTRIYNTHVPEGVSLPYLVFQHVAGGTTNETPTDALDVQFQVKAVSLDPVQAGALEASVRAALHNAALATQDGWGFYDCEHLNPFFLSEDVDRRQVFSAGGTYRIRAHQ